MTLFRRDGSGLAIQYQMFEDNKWNFAIPVIINNKKKIGGTNCETKIILMGIRYEMRKKFKTNTTPKGTAKSRNIHNILHHNAAVCGFGLSIMKPSDNCHIMIKNTNTPKV